MQTLDAAHLRLLESALGHNPHHAIIVTDGDGTIRLFNATAQRWLGYSEQEVVGRFNAADFHDPDELARSVPALEAALGREVRPDFDVLSAIVEQEDTEESEWSYRRKDGSRFPVRLSVTAICGENGASIGFTMIARDTSRRVQVLETLRENEERYRAVVEVLDEGIVLQGADGSVHTCNRGAERMLGLTMEQMNDPYLPGAPWDVIGEDGLPLPTSQYPLIQTLQTGQEVSRTVMGIRKPDGEITWLSANARPLILSEGQPQAVMMSFTDITERKRFEADLARARDAAVNSTRLKSAFLANVSHEIRTPMNGILGMVELLSMTELVPEQRSFVTALESSAESLLAIINDLLDLSKIEAGKFALEAAEVDARAVVEDVLELLAARAHAKGIEVASFIAEEVPALLGGDAGRLRQILMNLLSNAIKFTDNGAVVAKVGVQSETSTSVTLRFEISDTGVGIAPTAQAHVFDPFWQGDNSATRKYGGTGLGLAISRQFVELMGGRIWVESALGRGSTFSFTVHLQRLPTLELPAGETARSVPEFAKYRVLIVDDSETSRQLLAQMLDSWNMSHDSAVSGHEALAMLRAATEAGTPFHLALLDQDMPGMGGAELARTIKGDPLLTATRLVLLTSLRCDAAHGPELDACLTKPIRQTRLQTALQRALSLKTAEPPAVIAARQTSKGDQKPERSGEVTPDLTGMRVLVVEDNAVNQQVVISYLKKWGCDFELATNGLEALEMLDHAPYDLVLMDCQMPALDGYEATREIRRREYARSRDAAAHNAGRYNGGINGEGKQQGEILPNTHPLYIVAMTAHAMPQDRDKCLAVGMDDYLSKPLNSRLLRHALEHRRSMLRSKTSTRRLAPGNVVDASPPDTVPDAPPIPPNCIIDSAALTHLRETLGSGQAVATMIALFLADAPTRLEAIQAALKEGNALALGHQAHALRGSCSHFGASRLMDALEYFEKSEINHAAAEIALSHIETEFALVREALQKFGDPQEKSLPF